MTSSEDGPAATSAFQPDLGYEKHPQVALRHEGFGGLAYHYGNRRLVFLKSQALLDVVEALAEFPTAADALAARAPGDERAACAAALPALLASGIIRAREAS
ncbi:MAG TPA: mycofactocin biosynthesis chaperone MftB [Streptosporangiaceae bacterium]|jgi:putative mycofactocin binding protein MftB